MSKVSKLEKYNNKLDPTNKSKAVKDRACNKVSSPEAKGLFFVLSIFLSDSLSKIWFKAAEAAANKAKPRRLAKPLKIFE